MEGSEAMSVVVFGMEMPVECELCWFDCCWFSNRRPELCPLREIPEVEPDEIDEAMIAEAEKENSGEIYRVEDVKRMLEEKQ